MFSDGIRHAAINALAKFKVEEGIPLCLMVKEQTWHGDDWDPFDLLENTYRGAARDALPTLYKWRAHLPQFAADGSITAVRGRYENIESKIHSTIAAIENDTESTRAELFQEHHRQRQPDHRCIAIGKHDGQRQRDGSGQRHAQLHLDQGQRGGKCLLLSGRLAGEAVRAATFDTPGTYVLRVTAVDRSILDYSKWITFNLGYFDFQTYNEILGGVTKDVTVMVNPDPNRAPVPQNQSITTPLNTACPSPWPQPTRTTTR